MTKFVIIDGSSLLVTSFFGSAPKEYTNEKDPIMRAKMAETLLLRQNGRYINGVQGFLQTLRQIVEETTPTHLAVAWDVSREETFRRAIYEGYKAHRPEPLPELKEQFSTMQQILEAVGVAQYRLSNYEADDIVGTLAKRFESQMPVYIYAKDQDALQLVTNQTRVWFPTSKVSDWRERTGNAAFHWEQERVFEFTPETVLQLQGVTPLQIIDAKAIEGDKADNIPGVAGVGEKSSRPLLRHFGSVEAIFLFMEQTPESEIKILMKDLGIKKSPHKNLLADDVNGKSAQEWALLSKELATIRTDLEELQMVTSDELQMNWTNERIKQVLDQFALSEAWSELLTV